MAVGYYSDASANGDPSLSQEWNLTKWSSDPAKPDLKRLRGLNGATCARGDSRSVPWTQSLISSQPLGAQDLPQYVPSSASD